MSGSTIWGAVRDAIEATGACALVTVLGVEGSSPRETGARMVVWPDGRFSGTIGGGALEFRAIAMAARLAAAGEEGLWTEGFSLGPDLGQCCGGRVRLAIEVVTAARRAEVDSLAAAEAEGRFTTRAVVSAEGRVGPREPIDGDREIAIRLRPGELVETFGAETTPVVLFGAGHVGRALVLALAPLPFRVTWVDGRPDAFPARVPASVRCVAAEDPAPVLAQAPDGAMILVMTHSHALDQAVVHAALGEGRFAYVGMIGSRTKRARIRSRLKASGLAEAALSPFVCPIGLPAIRSKHPAAIAAGVAADLLIRREALAGQAEDRGLAAKAVIVG